MSSRGMYLVGMLVLLFLANLFMLMGMTNWPSSVSEGFTSELIQSGTSRFGTDAIGPYDGMDYGAKLPAASGGWRGKLPNEPLTGPAIEVGPDNLFIFKNNQCKPECCGATLSCDGGCVCSTPEQRELINTRGGNRMHDGGF
jgi:hypothetical protein